MRKNSMDMINGPITSSIIRFAVPMLLSGLLQILFNAADTIVVGRFAGHTSMAAIGATASITNLLVNLFMGLSIGVNVVVARNIGMKDGEKVDMAVHTAVALSVISGVALSVTGFIFSPLFLTLMDTPHDVMDKAVLYMRIIFLGQPFNLIYNFASAILRADGDTKRPLYYLTFAGLLNVIMNLIFVIGVKMDVAGVAAATIISQGVSAVLVMRALRKGDGNVRFSFSHLSLNGRLLKDILHMGVPAALQSVLFSLSNVLIQSSVNTFGSLAVAGNTAANSIDGFLYTVNNTLAQTNLSFLSQNYGAGKKERIVPIMRSSMIITVLAAMILGTICLFFGPTILSLYSDESEVIAFAMYRVRIVLSVYFIFAFEEMTVSCIRALGYSVLPMLISIFCICGFRIMWIFTYFAYHHTLQSLYIAYPLSWTLATVFHVFVLLYIWKKRNPFAESRINNN
ncbi:MAG: MATE family efflux transporter [Bullifex sp.]